MKRRRLSDVYKPGQPVKFDDGQGPVEVWVQKLSPVDHDSAVRKANAARARQLMSGRNPDSEEYQAIWSDVESFPSMSVLVDLLVDDKLSERRLAVEAEVGAKEEWDEDSYLQGLYDSWTEEMQDRWVANNDDPEAKHVYDELQRFNEVVQGVFQKEVEAEREIFQAMPRDEILKRATEFFVERRATSAFLTEFQRAQIYFSVREPDNHRSYYFKDGIEEVDDLAEEVRERLLGAYEAVSVDPLEGKGSGETQPSSTSSEPPETEETPASSGLRAVNQ